MSIKTGHQFSQTVLSSLADCASPQLRPGQSIEVAQLSRRAFTALTIQRTYGDGPLPFTDEMLAYAYRAAQNVPLPPEGDKQYHTIRGRKETAGHLAQLLRDETPWDGGTVSGEDLAQVGSWWLARASEIEKSADPEDRQTAAVVATLRREGQVLLLS